MLKYDPRDIGKKVKEINSNIKKTMSLFNIEQKDDLIHYIQSKIIECIPDKDITTASAIIECAAGNNGILPQELNLQLIKTLAVQNNCEDFAVSFIGMCELNN